MGSQKGSNGAEIKNNPHKKNLHNLIRDGLQYLCWKYLSQHFYHVDFCISASSSPFTWTRRLERTSRHLTVQTSNGVKLELCSAQIFLAHIYSVNCICLPHALWNTNRHVQHTQSSTYTLQYTVYSRGAASTACRLTQKKERKCNSNKQL